MPRLIAIPNDPISAYVKKGEIKERYFNPGDIFDRVDLISLADEDVDPALVQGLAGRAELRIHPVGRPSMASLPLYFPKVKRLIKGLKADLIRAHNPWVGGSLAVYAADKLDIPVMIYLHIENDQRRKFDPALIYRLIRPLERYSLSRADLTICVSGFLEDYAHRYGAGAVTTVYNKVYVDQFSGPERTRLSRPARILYVGRLASQKSPDLIIKALAGLEAELTVIGDGPARPALESLIKEMDLSGRVKFIPSVPHNRIQEHYRQADIFALATKYEGFCIPVLEAMAAGLPVVASDTPPLPEVLGGTGLIVPAKVQDFHQALKGLIQDPEQALRLGRRARERAKELDGRIMEEREVELYRSLLMKR